MIHRACALGVVHHAAMVHLLVLLIEFQGFPVIPVGIQIQGQFLNRKGQNLQLRLGCVR